MRGDGAGQQPPRPPVLLLRYEEFVHDVDAVFDAFETFFGAPIPRARRANLTATFDVRRVFNRTASLGFGARVKLDEEPAAAAASGAARAPPPRAREEWHGRHVSLLSLIHISEPTRPY